MYGDKIAALRRARSMTQEQLASSLGLLRVSISHYENNRREPDYRTLIKIADFFKVTTDYIIR
ncbi:helix-turn-helix domain-containing protein [Paenibacillus sedimenti]|uniref:Helix-turn-helix transcriptional regulator n=1 Tax=Paenibacillus sedimenti TaxID=2770274 RepID=A0A926KS77_9BACL|nr:helix-turn-helix transcriptional regulator [Paenibacillus sedimenti]MBD0381239.1 helix-turn-helix transcriptional regulator [Paenibacillus sedimenti]